MIYVVELVVVTVTVIVTCGVAQVGTIVIGPSVVLEEVTIVPPAAPFVVVVDLVTPREAVAPVGVTTVPPTALFVVLIDLVAPREAVAPVAVPLVPSVVANSVADLVALEELLPVLVLVALKELLLVIVLVALKELLPVLVPVALKELVALGLALLTIVVTLLTTDILAPKVADKVVMDIVPIFIEVAPAFTDVIIVVPLGLTEVLIMIVKNIVDNIVLITVVNNLIKVEITV
jgi:hypothetical protein